MAPPKHAALFLVALVTVSPFAAAQDPPPPPPVPTRNCSPLNVLSLAVCADLLGALALNLTLGEQETTRCCPVIGNLVGLGVGAAPCLCTAINALGLINLDLGVDLTGVIRGVLPACNQTQAVPSNFNCTRTRT